MMTRTTIAFLFFAAVAAGQPAISERARKLHQDAFVFDGHIHMIDRQFYLGGDVGERVADGQVDLPRAREGGIDAMFFSIFVQRGLLPAAVRDEARAAADRPGADATGEEPGDDRAGAECRRHRAHQPGRQDGGGARPGGRLRSGWRPGRAARPLSAGAALGATVRRTTGPTISPIPAARRRNGTG